MSSDQKTVLAALLAVKHGFVTPERAMELLRQAGDGAESIATIAPGSALEQEVHRLAQDSEATRAALTELGVAPEVQKSLLEGIPAAELLQETLFSIAASAAATAGEVPAVPEFQSDHRYDVKAEHARGGMGRILLAFDRSVGREVALKELLTSPTGSGSPFTPPSNTRDAMERFLREARVTGRLEHPNIVPVYEIGQRSDGSIFYTMKFVRGTSLSNELKRIAALDSGRLQQRLRLLEPWQDACNAIAYAHARGVIHRDIKPANIMLGDFGETLVLDWGLARIRRESPETTPTRVDEEFNDSPALTMDGAVLGTPAYMPPEQARGQIAEVDERSDVYALGAVLYEILTGRPPYEGKSGASVVRKVIEEAPPAVLDIAPDAPPELAALCSKAMSRDRNQRPASVLELVEEVRAYREGRALSVYEYSSLELLRRFITRHRAVMTACALALAVMAVLAVLSYFTIRGERDRALDAELLAAQQRDQARISAADAREAERRAQTEAERAKASDREAQLRATRQMLLQGERLEQDGLWDQAREVYAACRESFVRLGESPAVANIYLAYANSVGPSHIRTLGSAAHPTHIVVGEDFSPDGTLYACAYRNELFVYSEPERRYLMHRSFPGSGSDLVFFIDDSRVGVVARNGLHILDVNSGDVRVIEIEPGFDGSMLCASGDRSRLIIYGQDQLVAYDTRTWSELARTSQAPGLYVSATGNSDGSRWIAWGSVTRLLAYSGASIGETEIDLGDDVATAAVFVDDNQAVIGISSGRILLWDCAANRLLRELGSGHPILDIARRASDGLIAVARKRSGVVFLEPSKLEPSTRYKGFPLDAKHLKLTLPKRGDRLLCVRDGRGVASVDLETGYIRDDYPDHHGFTWCLPLDSGMVVTGAFDGKLYVRNAATGATLAASQIEWPFAARPITTSPDDTVVYVAALHRSALQGAALCALRLPGLEPIWRIDAPAYKAFVAASPDGQWLATQGNVTEVVLRQPATGDVHCLLEWTGLRPATAARFSPDSRRVMVGNELGLCEYEVPSGRLLRTIDLSGGTSDLRRLFDISPDLESALFLSPGYKSLAVVRVDTGTVQQTLTFAANPGLADNQITSGQFVSNTEVVAASDRRVGHFSCTSGRCVWTQALSVSQPALYTAHATVARGGCLMSAASADGILQIYSLPRASVVGRGTAFDVTGATSSIPGDFLALPHDDGETWVWDVQRGLPVFAVSSSKPCLAAAVSHDGRALVTADQGGVVRAWSGPTGLLLSESPGDGQVCKALEFLDGSLVACALGNGEIVIRRFPSLEEVRRIRTTIRSVTCVELNGLHGLALLGQYWGNVEVVDLHTGRSLGRYMPIEPIHSGCFSLDGTKWALRDFGDSLAIRETRSGQFLVGAPGTADHRTFGAAVCFLDNDRLLLCSAPSGGVDLRDAHSGRVIRSFATRDEVVWLSANNEGTRLLMGSGARLAVAFAHTRLPEHPGASDFADRSMWELAGAALTGEEDAALQARCALHCGRFEVALSALGPESGALRGIALEAQRRGELMLQQGQPMLAQVYLRLAVRSGPTPAAKYFLAECCYLQGNVRDAEELFLDSIAAKYQVSTSRLRLGSLYREAGKLDEAIEILDALVKDADSGYYDRYRGLHLRGIVHFDAGRHELAMSDMDSAARKLRIDGAEMDLLRAVLSWGRTLHDAEAQGKASDRALKLVLQLVSSSQAYDKVLMEGPEFAGLRQHPDFQSNWDKAIAARKDRILHAWDDTAEATHAVGE